MDIGIQLFGCHKLFDLDPAGFIKKLSDMGYTMIEPCVSFGMELPFAWTASNAAQYAGYVRMNGMRIDSAHLMCREPLACADDMLKTARITGIKRYVLGCRGPYGREELDAFAAMCRALSDKLAEGGVELWMHCNPPEIRTKIDGMSAYEYVLRACGGKLGAQVDTGWVVVGGEELSAFLERNTEYIRSIHHKDIASLPDEKGFVPNVALGKGIVDPRTAFEFAKKHGLGQVMDQDNTIGDFEADLRDSAAYLIALDK